MTEETDPKTEQYHEPRMIEELGGYVHQEQALELLGTSSQSWLNDLVRTGRINVAYGDNRTLMYNQRSLQRYLESKRNLHTPVDANGEPIENLRSS